MVIGSTFVNPHVLNLTSFLLWTWSFLPATWSNALLRSYIFLTELPSRLYTQTTRSYTALKHSFATDAYLFYNVNGHTIAQHANSTVVKVTKGNPNWRYTPHSNIFSYVGPRSFNRQTPEILVTKRYPVIGASLYCKTSELNFEYDMSEWISNVRVVANDHAVANSLPLSVLVLGWGLANEVCFEGDLSKMEIVLMSDMGEEKRYNVVTETEIAELEEGEIPASSDDLVVSEEDITTEEDLSSESHHPPTPEENLEEID